MANEDTFHLGVKAVIRNEDGNILLLKVNARKLIGVEEAYWDIPGGRVQRGHTIEETLQREVAEETGVRGVRNIRHITTVLSNLRIPLEPQDVGLLLAVYSCEIEPVAALTLSDEHTESAWFAPSEAARLLETKYPKEFTESLAALV